MTSPVIDISHHQPDPDFAKLKEAGVVGVILKCTEGTTYIDPTWIDRAADALTEGLCVATYHFLRPGDIELQIEHYIDEQDRLMPLGSRVVLDHEDEGVSLEDLAWAVNCLVDMRPDLQVTIYSGHLIKEQLAGNRNEVLARHTSLWIAQYTSASAPDWPEETWPVWSLWQWTDSETVPGIGAPVDGDRWNGSEDALRMWFNPTDAGPQQGPGTDVIYVDVDVGIGPVPSGISVVVRVNGKET